MAAIHGKFSMFQKHLRKKERNVLIIYLLIFLLIYFFNLIYGWSIPSLDSFKFCTGNEIYTMLWQYVIKVYWPDYRIKFQSFCNWTRKIWHCVFLIISKNNIVIIHSNIYDVPCYIFSIINSGVFMLHTNILVCGYLINVNIWLLL